MLLLVACEAIGWEAVQRFGNAVPVAGKTVVIVAAIGIASEAVQTYLRALPGVTDIHDLHIWGMSTTEAALTAHLVMPQGHPGDRFMGDATEGLQHRFRIHHATLQVELGEEKHDCPLSTTYIRRHVRSIFPRAPTEQMPQELALEEIAYADDLGHCYQLDRQRRLGQPALRLYPSRPRQSGGNNTRD